MRALLVLYASAVVSAADDDRRIPECGVAAVYGVCTLLDIETSPEQVEDVIKRRDPEADLSALSLSQIVRAIEDLGLAAEASRAEPDEFDRIPVPAIAYIRPERINRGDPRVGHVVILTAASAHGVRALDLTESRRPIEVSMDHLRETWDGEFVSVSKVERRRFPRNVWQAASVIVCGIALVLFCGLAVRSARPSSVTRQANEPSARNDVLPSNSGSRDTEGGEPSLGPTK